MTWHESYLAVTIALGFQRQDAEASLASPEPLRALPLWSAARAANKMDRARAMAAVLTRVASDVAQLERP